MNAAPTDERAPDASTESRARSEAVWARWQQPATNREVGVDRLVIGALAALAAIFATLDGAAPTGSGRIDGLWRAAAAVVIVLCSAFAPPVFLVISAVGSAVASAQMGLILVGAVATLIAVLVAWRTPDWHGPSALVGMLISSVVFRLPHDQFLGVSTLVALAVVAPLLLAAVYEGPLWLVRLITWGAVGTAAIAFAGLVVFGLVVFDHRGDLEAVSDLADEAEQHFRDGDEVAAQDTLAEAIRTLESIESSTGSTWMNLTRVVPVLGQHTLVLQQVARSGVDTARAAEAVLEDLDRDSLTISAGAVELDAVRVMEPSVSAFAAVSDQAAAEMREASSPWLVPPVANALDNVLDDLDQLATASARADDAVRLAPTILGGEGQRNHLVLLATPAELRGSVGLIGNWALVQANEGRLTLAGVGRASELVTELETLDVSLREPAEYLDRYRDNSVETAFHDVTLSPDFPDVALVAAQLYEAATGTPIDTVMLVDPAGIADLMELTGPIQVDDTQLDATNARDFLLISQYVLFGTNEERVEFLDEMLTQTFTRLLRIDFPDPWDLDEVFADVVAEDRLVVASTDPAEQALLEDLGVGGEFPTIDPGDDLVAVVVQNQGQNKIDSWLGRRTVYAADIDPYEGTIDATIALEFTNSAPTELMPDAVVGSNDQGLPRGTNRMAVTVYSPHRLREGRVNGAETGFQVQDQFGVNSFTTVIDIPNGETATVELDVSGTLALGTQYRLVMPVQPSVTAEQIEVRLAAPAGVSLGDGGARFITDVITSADQTFEIPISD